MNFVTSYHTANFYPMKTQGLGIAGSLQVKSPLSTCDNYRSCNYCGVSRQFLHPFSIDSAEAFFSRLQNRGVRIWLGVEIFPQYAVFIAQHTVFISQQMLDQILRICKSGFFGHVWCLLLQNQSSYIYNNKLFCSLWRMS